MGYVNPAQCEEVVFLLVCKELILVDGFAHIRAALLLGNDDARDIKVVVFLK